MMCLEAVHKKSSRIMTKRINILHQYNQINISIAHSAHYFKRLLLTTYFVQQIKWSIVKMTIVMHFVVPQTAVQWNCPQVSKSSLLNAVVFLENEKREWVCDPMSWLFTMVGLWDWISKQDNVLLTILTGQFGWHILGISADSMTATCTSSTNSHLQLQMVHNFFPVFITALGGGVRRMKASQPSCPSQVSIQSC